jgi:hypothetical protein
MRKVPKIALGIVLTGVVLIGGCAIVFGALKTTSIVRLPFSGKK